MGTGTRLETPPCARRLRLEDARENHGERSVHSRAGGGEPQTTTSRAELETQRQLGRDGVELDPEVLVSSRTVGVAARECPQQLTECSGSNERLRIDHRSIGEEPSRAQPGGKRRRCGDVVDAPDRDLRVDEVLNEVERRRRG